MFEAKLESQQSAQNQPCQDCRHNTRSSGFSDSLLDCVSLLWLDFDFYLVLEALHLPPVVSEWKFKVASTLQTTTNHRLQIFLSYSTLANKWWVPTRKVGLITTPSSATRQHNHWANESECSHGSSRNANRVLCNQGNPLGFCVSLKRARYSVAQHSINERFMLRLPSSRHTHPHAAWSYWRNVCWCHPTCQSERWQIPPQSLSGPAASLCPVRT